MTSVREEAAGVDEFSNIESHSIAKHLAVKKKKKNEVSKGEIGVSRRAARRCAFQTLPAGVSNSVRKLTTV